MWVFDFQSAPVWLPYGSPKARCTPGTFSSCSRMPIMSVSARLVPKAGSRGGGAEGEPANAVGPGVGGAVAPDFGCGLGGVGVCADGGSAGNFERQGRGREVAVLRAEVVARRAVADEDAVHGPGRREDL